MQVTKNSHYIARHLTKPWEFKHGTDERQLWFYDFDDDAFDVDSSRNLNLTDEPWPERVEHFLRDYLETPLAAFLARFRETRRTTFKKGELRAMKLAVLLQGERTFGDLAELEMLVERGWPYLNRLVAGADQTWDFCTIPLRAQRLFFPETGIIMGPACWRETCYGHAVRPSALVRRVAEAERASYQTT